jgi:uncharacterized protein YeaO (DUF488 family)
MDGADGGVPPWTAGTREVDMSEQRASTHTVRIRRVYDPVDETDGRRILVDRLWPRGLSKERADLDEWMRDIAPSTVLRQWYGHDPGRYVEFRTRYIDELMHAPGAEDLNRLRQMLSAHDVTLLTAARALDISEAAVLEQLLLSGP